MSLLVFGEQTSIGYDSEMKKWIIILRVVSKRQPKTSRSAKDSSKRERSAKDYLWWKIYQDLTKEEHTN